jgi:hypothetical protein
MDIAPPPKPVAASAADIPTKTGGALPVQEPPRSIDDDEQQATADQQPADVPAPASTPPKPRPAGRSIAGIVAATVVAMIALASLTIVVYLKS